MSRRHATRTHPVLAVVLCVLLVLALVPGGAAAEPPNPRAEVPAPDLLDVDLSTGSLTDVAAGRESTVFGDEPAITDDHALGRATGTFNGSNAVRYDFSGGYDIGALTIECTIRVAGPLSAVDDRSNFCGSKEGGGFSLNAGQQAKVLVNVDGKYATVGADISYGVWYHVVGVWDGVTLALYLNGEKVDETPAAGEVIKVPSAEYFFIAADTDPAGEPQYFGTGQVASAALYSRALSADQVASRYADAFADRTTDLPSFVLESPDSDARLRVPTTLTGEVREPDLLAGNLTYTLDGDPVSLGDPIGPGLSRGEHTLTHRGLDRLGRAVDGSATFTSAAIPTPEGTEQVVDNGTAQLTAAATHPTGGHLRTTFLEGTVLPVAEAQWGTVPATAYDRTAGVAAEDAQLADAKPVADDLLPADGEESDSPSTNQIPALQGQVEFTEAGQTIVWRGTVDPARQVDLLLLNTETDRYEIVDSARGVADDQVELAAPATAANDDDGVVRTLVVGVDPFADDLKEPVQNSFGDPADFDFSLMHITDPQYLVGATIGKDNPAERAVWRAGYEDSYRWLGQHADEYNVEFVGHTGDLVDSWRKKSTDRERAAAEFEVSSEIHKLLDDTGIPNAVLPGNHDNKDGEDSGPESLYNSYFGPERYEKLAQTEGWQERDAEYHPWKPGDNDNNYVLFSAGGEEFVVVSLGYQVTEEEAAWASGVFEEHSGRNGIMMTHAAHSSSMEPDGRGGPRSPDGELISKQVMEQNPNVILMLAGHVTGATINVRTDVGGNGNNVVELTHDYQGYRISSDKLGITDLGNYDGDTPVTYGATFFRLLQFDLDRGELNVDTYSGHLGEFGATEYDPSTRYDGREDDFRVPIQVQGRTTSFSTDSLFGMSATEKVIGAVVHDSGTDATVIWDELPDHTAHAWYAVSQDVRRGADAATLRAAARGEGRGPAGVFEDGIVQYGYFTTPGT